MDLALGLSGVCVLCRCVCVCVCVCVQDGGKCPGDGCGSDVCPGECVVKKQKATESWTKYTTERGQKMSNFA